MKLIINQPPGLKYVQPIEPVNPAKGDSWYNTETNKMFVYDGRKWVGEK